MSRIPVQLSPGVNYSEIDLTTIAPNVATATGAIAGVFRWGPGEKITTITSEDDLVRVFGKPYADDDGRDFHCAANFLQYARDLRVVRAVASDTTNANSLGLTQEQYMNEDVLQATSGLTMTFLGRYPGSLGNSLKVVVIDGNGEVQLTTGSTGALGTNTIGISYGGTLAGNIEENDKLIFQLGDFAQTFLVESASGNTVTTKTFIASTIGKGATIKYRSKYADLFQLTAETSTQATSKGGSNDELNVAVVDEDGLFTGSRGTIVETFQNVSKAYDARNNDGQPNYITSAINGQSNYIWAADVESLWGETTTKDLTYTFSDMSSTFAGVKRISLSGGVDSSTSRDRIYTGGYSKFVDKDVIDISLLISGRSDETTVKLLADIVNDRKDCVLFVSPQLSDVLNKSQAEASSLVVARRNSYGINSSYVVMDSGWKYIYDKYNDKFVYIPLNADVAGLCARSEFSTQAWFSPAGLNRGTLRNVIKLTFNPDQSARDYLYVAGVNPVTTFTGEGTILFGDKTMLKKPSAFDRINVRRLFNTLEKTISTAAKYSLFEFNDEFTRAQFRNLVIPYLRGVQAQRGITDFRVVCDETNNTSEVVDRNQFVADIYIKPARSINFIQLNFIATRTDSAFTEII
jgi:hypothetical protein